jgi:predicted N-acyltransferase
MQIDYSDFDDLIEKMIKSARIQSERVSGQAYGLKTIKVTGNQKTEKVYPIQPFVEDVSQDPDSNVNYEYIAGFEVVPEDLKEAVKIRVADVFSIRQSLNDGVIKDLNLALEREKGYSYDYI